MRLSGGLLASRAGIVQEEDEEKDDDMGVKEDLCNDHNVRMDLTPCFKGRYCSRMSKKIMPMITMDLTSCFKDMFSSR